MTFWQLSVDVCAEGLEQLLIPLTERVRSDFALSLTAVDSTLKDSVQQLVNAKVGWFLPWRSIYVTDKLWS